MHRTTAGEEQFSGGGQWSETRRLVQLSPSQSLLQSPWFPSTPGPLSTVSTRTSICSTVSTSHQDRTQDRRTDLLVASASDALVNEMVLNSGWRYAPGTKHQDLWKDQITESFNLACVTLNDHAVLSDPLRKRIVQSMSSIRSKMVRTAEDYVRDYLKTDAESSAPEQAPAVDYYTSLGMRKLVAEITNPSNPGRFFLHKQGPDHGVERIFGDPILETFHLDFWYGTDTSPVMKFRSSYTTTPPCMLAFSGVALLCALHRVTNGRCSNSGDTLKFTSDPYAKHFKQYCTAIVDTLKDDYGNGPGFRKQLKELNEQGMERIQSSGGTAAFRALQPFVIPRAVMATSPGAGTSSDIPDIPTLPAASHFDLDFQVGAGTSSDIPDIPTLPAASHFDLDFQVGGGDYYSEFHPF